VGRLVSPQEYFGQGHNYALNRLKDSETVSDPEINLSADR